MINNYSKNTYIREYYQFLEKCFSLKKLLPSIRIGQLLYVEFYKIFPYAAKSILRTDKDPFYTDDFYDESVSKFLKFVEEVFKKHIIKENENVY